MSKKLIQAAAGAGGESVYVDDVFSTYLVTGTGAAPAVNNGIDLSGEGGLVWLKKRSSAGSHDLFDTERGANKRIITNNTNAEDSKNLSFTSTGFSNYTLDSGIDYVSWSFRKQAGFFDVVTYTGNATNRTISHNLSSVPGCIIVRSLSGDNWYVWHRSLPTGALDSSTGHKRLILNSTAAVETRNGINTVTSTSFDVLGTDGETNGNSTNYVAYVFAHDDQSFGDDSDKPIIKCGTYTGTNNTVNEINVGFEPQWLMIKGTDRACDWIIVDVMRGASAAPSTARLEANTSDAEAISTSVASLVHPTATGFKIPSGVSGQVNEYNEGYIYIAIRRPMKTPTAGTDVFASSYNQEVSSATSGFYSGFPVDLAIKRIITASQPNYLFDRLRGAKSLRTNLTNAEGAFSAAEFDHQEGFYYDADSANTNDISWMFKRATGFFDVVAYKGSNSVYLKDHNLGVVPEMMIVKNRDAAETGWSVYHSALGADYRVQLNSTSASSAASDWDNASDVGTAPTATQFNVKAASVIVNSATSNYVAYLFATLAGVSKVGSYTGNGSSQNIDCGFSSGARFVLIKRTDSSSNWYLFDSIEQGIVAGNDPHIALNTTDAQYTSDDLVDPYSSGFAVTSYVNTSSAEYIFLAIA